MHANHRSILLGLKKHRQVADNKCARLAALRAEVWDCWRACIADEPTPEKAPSTLEGGSTPAPSTSALAYSKAQQELHCEAKAMFQWALPFRREIIHKLGLTGLWDAEAARLKDSFEVATNFEYEDPPEPLEYLEGFFPQLGIVWERLAGFAPFGASNASLSRKRLSLTPKEQRLEALLRKLDLLDEFVIRPVGHTIKILQHKHARDPDVQRLFRKTPEARRSALRRLKEKRA